MKKKFKNEITEDTFQIIRLKIENKIKKIGYNRTNKPIIGKIYISCKYKIPGFRSFKAPIKTNKPKIGNKNISCKYKIPDNG